MLFGGECAKSVEHTRHQNFSLNTGHRDVAKLMAEVAELLFQAAEIRNKVSLTPNPSPGRRGEASTFPIEGQLGEEQGRAAGVLVADLRRHEIAVAFLAAEDEIVGRPLDVLVGAVSLQVDGAPPRCT